MFCPKCGQQNLETGKFCRSCGTDLGNVSDALAAGPKPLVGKKERSRGCEAAITQIFMGSAFLLVAILLGVTGKGGGWWFWMLIPAFGMLGSGVAKYVQHKNSKPQITEAPATMTVEASASQSALPPQPTHFVSADSRYKTGDLVPPSVTDSTTRHLELNSEGQTMTLPKK